MATSGARPARRAPFFLLLPAPEQIHEYYGHKRAQKAPSCSVTFALFVHFGGHIFFEKAVTVWAGVVALATVSFAAENFRPVDTQPSGQPLPPREAAARLHAPPGFKVTLAAAEPDVRQPIAIAFDDRGRLWVAESYSYAGSNFTAETNDRILIFEDADGDGVFESRKVFCSGLGRLTSLALGFGGVWVTTAPHLAFIPDRNGDDQPDGPPEVLLDGWTTEAEHNTVNGLTWGPDGWLYGRHGIKKASLVGRPGTPDSARTELSCAIWRFHPTRRVFEVVADGTINPWGLDFDAHGQAFISTSVVDHFWHVIPGARFERWKDRGGHPDPYAYELMSPTSDHLHWGGGAWDQGGRLSTGNDARGGGHSHCDALIYLGDRWPAEYRGTVLMSNIHGRRINRDAIVRRDGNGPFTATHQADFLRVDDPWFRAVSLEYGPDGDVVMTDWSDHGECHDRDGVHRSSGRIYKISWGSPRRVAVDLGRLSATELVALQTHANEWFVRHARRRLQELAHAGTELTAAQETLRAQLRTAPDSIGKLRALWALHAIAGLPTDELLALLGDADEHLRHWAIRLLVDSVVAESPAQPAGNAPASVGRAVAPATTLARRLASALTGVAATEKSWLVQQALASSLNRLDLPARFALTRALLGASATEVDPNLTRLLWYGFQPCVAAQPAEAAALAANTGNPRLRQFIARRLAEAWPRQPAAGTALLDTVVRTDDPALLTDLLQGTNRGLKGQRSLTAPAPAVARIEGLARSNDPALQRPAALLAATLGSTTALDALRHQMRDTSAPAAARTVTLEKLAELRPAWLLDELLELLRAGQLAEAVLRVLPSFPDVRAAETVVTMYPSLPPPLRTLAIDALTGRAAFARVLLDAIAGGQLERKVITLAQARQITRLGDAALTAQLDRTWGAVARPAGSTDATIARLRAALSPAVLAAANVNAGSTLFEQRCAACHKLFGRGQNIGPDLTGSGRKDLEYLLLNIVDPNASIPADYRLTNLTLNDGRVVSGSIAAESPSAYTVRTLTGELVLDRATVKQIERLPISLMPTGLLDGLSPDETRDLFGYLMSDGVP